MPGSGLESRHDKYLVNRCQVGAFNIHEDEGVLDEEFAS